MSDRIEQIETRAKAASEGPWGTLVDTYRTVPMHRIGADISGDDVAQVIYHGAQESSNAAFIANAREDVPYLLALAREQQARLDAVSSILDEWASHKAFPDAEESQQWYSLGKRHAADAIRAALTATEES